MKTKVVTSTILLLLIFSISFGSEYDLELHEFISKISFQNIAQTNYAWCVDHFRKEFHPEILYKEKPEAFGEVKPNSEGWKDAVSAWDSFERKMCHHFSPAFVKQALFIVYSKHLSKEEMEQYSQNGTIPKIFISETGGKIDKQIEAELNKILLAELNKNFDFSISEYLSSLQKTIIDKNGIDLTK